MNKTSTFDVECIRDHFPGLTDWAFFENAGGTLVPQSVIDRVRTYMSETQVQPGASYEASALATERIVRSQELMAKMINADPDEIIIGPSTTMNIYVLTQALGNWFKPGDELIVTNLDHEANSGAWRRLAELGVIVKEWQMDPDSTELETEALEGLLTDKTKLVCVTHCSNITGSIHDVREIARLVHNVGALICVDAVAYAPHRQLDVKALGVDFYAFSAYKLYGPHLGLLYGKREHLLNARGQNHFFIGEEDIPLKLIPGGVNHELTSGLSGIIDYFDAVHHHHCRENENTLHERLGKVFELISAYEEVLANRFVDFLQSKPNVRIIGRQTADKTRRVPTFSFVVAGRNSEEFPQHMIRHRIGIRAGHFYARRCIDALELGPQNGVVRASMVHYNTMEEVDRLIRHLDEVI